MSILNLKKETAAALGLADREDDSNPLEAIGLSWRVTLLGLDESALYEIVRGLSQRIVTKIHPDVIGRELTEEELKIMNAFERLKDRNDFSRYLEEFQAIRTEESHTSKQIKNQSVRVLRAAMRMDEERLKESQKRTTAEGRALYAENRLLGFLKAQAYFPNVRDNQTEIVTGKSTQSPVMGISGIKQLVVCEISVQFVNQPLKKDLDELLKVRLEIDKAVARYDELEEKIRAVMDNKDEKKRLEDLQKSQRSKVRNLWEEKVFQKNIGLPTLSKLLEPYFPDADEEAGEESPTTAPKPDLPFIQFTRSMITSQVDLPGKDLLPPATTESASAINERDRLANKILNSSETPQNLSEMYRYALRFYSLNSPEHLLVKRLRIQPRVIPVQDGALVGMGKASKRRSKIVGSIPLQDLHNLKAEMDITGRYYVEEDMVLGRLLPCVSQGSMLVIVEAASGKPEMNRMLKDGPENFFSISRMDQTVKFVSDFVVLAVY